MQKRLLGSNTFYLLFIGLVYIMHYWHYIEFLAKESNLVDTLFVVIFEMAMFAFWGICLNKSKETTRHTMKMLMFLMAITACTMFWFEYTYGRDEIYGIIIALISLSLVLLKKCEWMILPLWVIVSFVSANSLFLFFGIVFATLFYKCLKDKAHKKYKYILSGVIFVEVAGLFYYLFIDTTKLKWMNYLATSNLIQLPVVLFVSIPYIVLLFVLIRKIMKQCDTKVVKKATLVLMFGNILVIPTLFMEQNYGMWIFSSIAYYLILGMVLLSMEETYIENGLQELIDRIKTVPAGVLLLVYPIAFGPLEWLAIGKAFKLFKLYYGMFL